MKKFPILAVLLTGCAVHKSRITATPVVVIPRECITKVELTPDSECYLSADGNLTLCRHVNITRKERCEVLKVPKGEEK